MVSAMSKYTSHSFSTTRQETPLITFSNAFRLLII